MARDISMARHKGTLLKALDFSAVASLQDLVTRAIREAILTMEFMAGERLVQHELAASLGVSRQPVREALRRLESEGLVVRSGREIVVRAYSPEEIADILHFRILLEPEGVRLAAHYITEKEIAELEFLNEAMQKVAIDGDHARFIELNRAFHERIYRSARSGTLERIMDQLWKGWAVAANIHTSNRLSQLTDDHHDLIAALRSGDGTEAASIMHQHVSGARDAVVQSLRSNGLHDPAAPPPSAPGSS